MLLEPIQVHLGVICTDKKYQEYIQMATAVEAEVSVWCFRTQKDSTTQALLRTLDK